MQDYFLLFLIQFCWFPSSSAYASSIHIVVKCQPGKFRMVGDSMRTIARWTQSRMDTIPNGHHSECTQFRMDTIPNGHNSVWTQFQMDTISNGHNFKWTQFRMGPISNGTIPNGHHPKFTPFRIGKIPNEHLYSY